MLYIASDHGGFKYKQQLLKFLEQQGYLVKDLGAKKFNSNDDYPDYAKKVASLVSRNPLKHQGLLLCRSGQGVCIAANKFKNVRATLVWSEKQAKMSRLDDMGNVLCLPSDYITLAQAKKITEVWLNTAYSTDSRHIRRIKKIHDLERT